MKVGILALQGDVREHAAALADCGANAVPVRRPDDLAALDAIVLPGGESTTMSMLLGSSGLFGPLRDRLDAGLPAMGTCAGMILLAREIVDGRADQRSFGVIDVTVRRNAFGRQVDSFETELEVPALGSEPLPAVFIRAPIVEAVGDTVDVLATVADRPVLCRQGKIVVAAFHPELTGDVRVHQLFLQTI